MKAENIELVEAGCFSKRSRRSWLEDAMKTYTKGWKVIDMDKFQAELDSDCRTSAESLAIAKFRDVESDMVYILEFDNHAKAWSIQIKDSPDATISDEDKTEFFKSAAWSKFINYVVNRLDQNKKLFKDVLIRKMQSGELLSVDEDTFSAVNNVLNDQGLLNNLKSGKLH